jgi:hypothetical protein
MIEAFFHPIEKVDVEKDEKREKDGVPIGG